jgi:very-short-patch-repair endonuclease
VYDARPGELDGWATAPVTTVLMCARDLLQREALVIADSALRHRAVTEDALISTATAWPPHVQWLVAHASGRAANPFESALRSLALDCGVEMVLQFEVIAGGFVFHPDLADPIHGLILEADSWGWHADKESHERDCRRYTLLTIDGWMVLRFTYDDVMHRPDYVRSCIRAAYALRGHPLADAPDDASPSRRVDPRVA